MKGGFDLPTGRMPIEAPAPFKVEYPYGRPGDSFRAYAHSEKATCVAYHRDVPLAALADIRAGNEFRAGPGVSWFDEIVESMKADGFRGGSGQRLIIHVSRDDIWLAEGNHRRLAGTIAGLEHVELEIRYLGNADEDFLLIPFDADDPVIKVVAD